MPRGRGGARGPAARRHRVSRRRLLRPPGRAAATARGHRGGRRPGHRLPHPRTTRAGRPAPPGEDGQRSRVRADPSVLRPPLHGPGPLSGDPARGLRAPAHVGSRFRMDLRDAGQGARGRPARFRDARLLSAARRRLEDHRDGERDGPGGVEDPVDHFSGEIRARSPAPAPAAGSSQTLQGRGGPPTTPGIHRDFIEFPLVVIRLRKRLDTPRPPRPRRRSARPRRARAARAPSRRGREPARSSARDSPTCWSREC